MGPRRRLALAVLLAAGLAAPTSAHAADEELVRFLLKEGSTALEKGRTDDAIGKFRRATTEDRESPEAWAGLGQALEKKGDKPAAIAAYREVPAAMEARAKKGAPTADEQQAEKRASTRLDALAPGEVELRRIRTTYLADVLALARASVEQDPAIARRCVEAALSVAPADPAVRELSEKLGIEARAPAPAKPSDGNGEAGPTVSRWDDLVERKAFETAGGAYEGTSFVHEVRDKGVIVFAEPPPENGDRYVLEMEYRIVEATAVTSHGGWVFGEKGDRYLAAFAKADLLVLTESQGTEHKEVGRVELVPPKDSAFRRLRVAVDGRRLTISVDGRVALTHTLEEGNDAAGRVGVWTQRARVEYRRLRVGTP
jgi:tetratricopeptide (TPR) repeat protein